MKLSVTGDIHGDVFLLFGMTESMSDEEMLFVAGDFGMFWYDTKICQEKMLIINDILENKNSYIVFVDGNHDNHRFLNGQEVSDFYGAKSHKLMTRIIHIMRGEILRIDDIKIFCFGGAYSVDRFWRVKNETYFEEELPNQEEYDNGIMNLKRNNMKVDYILTHTCPRSLVEKLGARHNVAEEEKLQNFIQWVIDNVEYKMHYFGHWHKDKKINEEEIVIFNYVRDMVSGEVTKKFSRLC